MKNDKKAVRDFWEAAACGEKLYLSGWSKADYLEQAKIMIYHKYSFVGYMLWIRYGLLRLKSGISWQDLYGNYLESPETKAYSVKEAKQLFSKFKAVEIDTVLGHGDLLTSSAGQRHQGILLSVARLIWPRWMIKRFFPKNGLFMLITTIK